MNPLTPFGESMEPMTTPLRIAAIIALLSASALRGTTASKNAALCMHLETLLRQDNTLEANLRKTLEKALSEWKLTTHIHSCPTREPLPSHAAVPVLH